MFFRYLSSLRYMITGAKIAFKTQGIIFVFSFPKPKPSSARANKLLTESQYENKTKQKSEANLSTKRLVQSSVKYRIGCL